MYQCFMCTNPVDFDSFFCEECEKRIDEAMAVELDEQLGLQDRGPDYDWSDGPNCGCPACRTGKEF